MGPGVCAFHGQLRDDLEVMEQHKHRQRKRRSKKISFASLLAAAVAMTIVSGFIGVVAYRQEIPIVGVFLMTALLWMAGMFAVWAIATNRRAHRIKSEINPTVVRPAAGLTQEPDLSE